MNTIACMIGEVGFAFNSTIIITKAGSGSGERKGRREEGESVYMYRCVEIGI